MLTKLLADLANLYSWLYFRSMMITKKIIMFLSLRGQKEFHAYTVRPRKKKPINQVNFSDNCNDLSEKVYIVTKFSLSSFFWHQS